MVGWVPEHCATVARIGHIQPALAIGQSSHERCDAGGAALQDVVASQLTVSQLSPTHTHASHISAARSYVARLSLAPQTYQICIFEGFRHWAGGKLNQLLLKILSYHIAHHRRKKCKEVMGRGAFAVPSAVL